MGNFEGSAKMFNEEIYISQITKKGYDKVLAKIDPLLCGWAGRVYMPGYSFEDIKQELSIIAIEGVNAYLPDKNVQLSSFLTTHIKNKLISKLKSVNKLSNDASMLKGEGLAPSCVCDGVSGRKGEACSQCGLPRKKMYRSSREEYSFSSLNSDFIGNGGEIVQFESSVATSDNLYDDGLSEYDKADLDMALERLSKAIDPMTFDILKLVWVDGHSIKYAAKKVNVSNWSASSRLKRLVKNRIINDILSDMALKDM